MGMYNKDPELIIDPGLMEFKSIGTENSNGFVSVNILGKCGLAKIKKQ